MKVRKGLRKMFSTIAAATPLTFCATTVGAQNAQPGDAPVPSARRDVQPFSDRAPNSELITTGVLTLGLPYIVSIVVATGSPRNSDSYLYAPVVGPWLDLANREDCPADGLCGNETAYEIALVADGILQAVGALEIASGFAFPVPHSRTSGRPTRVRIAPSIARTSYGLSAVGSF